MENRTPPVRVVVCADDMRLRTALVSMLRGWDEFVVVDAVTSVGALTPGRLVGKTDLVIVDEIVVRRGVVHDAPHLVEHRIPVVVVARDAAIEPAVVEVNGGTTAPRAIRLPRWVLDRDDELTQAHTRALLLDLAGSSPAIRSTQEIESPVESSDPALRPTKLRMRRS